MADKNIYTVIVADDVPQPVGLLIVQGNIAQELKWRADQRIAILRRYIETTREAALAGVNVEPLSDGQLVNLRAELQQGNSDAVPLEKPPKVAVYVPPNASPWACRSSSRLRPTRSRMPAVF